MTCFLQLLFRHPVDTMVHLFLRSIDVTTVGNVHKESLPRVSVATSNRTKPESEDIHRLMGAWFQNMRIAERTGFYVAGAYIVAT